MRVKDRVAVVTGGGRGIGAAVARAYAAEGARGVVVADLPSDGLQTVAREIGGLAVSCDVSKESEVQRLIAEAERKFGPIDVFFSNAGIARAGQADASDADWAASWAIHVMAHVYAARTLVPGMLKRGSGYLLNTASAAGLLASMGSMPYGVTKHAGVALAEHLAIQYADKGIRVSVLCPQAVDTAMLGGSGSNAARVDGVLQPAEAAQCVIDGMDREDFLILTHPVVQDYMQRKANDPKRWIRGMQRLRDRTGG